MKQMFIFKRDKVDKWGEWRIRGMSDGLCQSGVDHYFKVPKDATKLYIEVDTVKGDHAVRVSSMYFHFMDMPDDCMYMLRSVREKLGQLINIHEPFFITVWHE